MRVGLVLTTPLCFFKKVEKTIIINNRRKVFFVEIYGKLCAFNFPFHLETRHSWTQEAMMDWYYVQ